MRDAESTLDQLISFCGNKIEEPDVLSMFGLTAQGHLLELSLAILNGEVQSALQLLNDLAKNGKDLSRLLSDLLNHFRNLLIFQVSRGDLNMLEVSEAEAAALRDQAKMADTAAMTRIMEVFTDAESKLRDAVSKKILLEVALLKAIEARNAVSLDAVLKRLQEMREGKGGEAPAVSAPAAASPTIKPFRAESAERRPPARPETQVAHPLAGPEAGAPLALADAVAAIAPVPGDGSLESLWARLVESVGRASPFTRSYLLEAHPVSFAKNLFIIGFDPEFADHLALVDNARNHALLQTKLSELGHPNTQFKFIKAEAPENRPVPVVESKPVTIAPAQVPKAAAPVVPGKSAPAAPPAKEKTSSVQFSPDDFKNDPLIQKALEVFKGQIVEVRA
jgi:DNA polymerase-3 subunit gamma/tau